jgi:hypothetical protein
MKIGVNEFSERCNALAAELYGWTATPLQRTAIAFTLIIEVVNDLIERVEALEDRAKEDQR